jgi:hypothetical protein
MSEKPLGIKAYGSIGHLPNSRLGPGDHCVTPGEVQIATVKSRKGDTVICEEKLDGSCCAVARVDGELLALSRAGYLATTSPYPQHHLYALWVDAHLAQFEGLQEGQRAVGEWLAQAHGTRYALAHQPFVVFDLMTGHARALWKDRDAFCVAADLKQPAFFVNGGMAIGIETVMESAGEHGGHNADPADGPEGAVWRVEREGRIQFLCKYVRLDKVDGKYLPDVSGHPTVWNTWPGCEALLARVPEIEAGIAAQRQSAQTAVPAPTAGQEAAPASKPGEAC